MRVLAAIVAGVLSVQAVYAAPEWTGKWAYDLAWCANTSASTDLVPIFLSDTEMLGYENTCDIINHVPLAVDGGYQLSLSCSSEGTAYEEEMLVLVEDGKTIFLYREGPSMTKYQRCE